MPERFVKKPVEIEAMQFAEDGSNWREVIEFTGRTVNGGYRFTPLILPIETLEGTLDARRGDWIIRGVKGEFYPCRPDIFDATYEPAPASPQEKQP